MGIGRVTSLRLWRGLADRWAELVVAALWVLWAALRLHGVPEEWWRWRDDAVITLSHARGWADTGIPSVSAAGERVEGYSSPLQLFLAGAYYRFGGAGWARFLDIQVVLGIAGAGYAAARFVRHSVPSAARWTVLVGGVVIAIVGLRTWVALGWLASGMENSLATPLLLAVMAGVVVMVRVPSTRGWALGAALGLAGIVRTEFAVLLVPTLALVLIVTWREQRRAGGTAVVIAVAVWLVAYVWRFMTFGTATPNTAVAQDRTVATGALPALALAGAVALATFAVWHRPRGRPAVAAVAAAATAVLAVRAAGWHAPVLDVVAPAQAAVLSALLVVVAAGWVMQAAGPVVWSVILVVGFVPITQQLLLGGARLDAGRIGGQSLVLLATAAGVVTVAALADVPSGPVRIRPAVVVGCAIALVGIALVWRAPATRATPLCCTIDRYRTALEVARQHAAELGAPRSIVASPDLGKLSFPKHVVIVDLGLLGDPVATNIDRRRPDLLDDYLTLVQVPDVVAVHGVWTCSTFRTWVRSRTFDSTYELARADDRGTSTPSCPEGDEFRYYRRLAGSPGYDVEMALAGDLAADASRGADLVADATARCAPAGTDPWRCQWVRRAIQRATPELRAAGTREAVVDVLAAASPTGDLDRLLLDTPTNWGADAADLVIGRLADQD